MVWVVEVCKKVMKEFGEWLGKDIVWGLVFELVEKMFEEGIKKVVGGVLCDFFCKVVFIGGIDVVKCVFEEYFDDGI